MSEPARLKVSPLAARHRALGARMIDFGGWEMPLQYSGILDEHHAVRRSVGVFDVSHMGEIEIRGPQALELTSYVTSNAPARLAPGQIQYSGLLNENGGFVDDILTHRVAEDHFFLCVNAANQERDYEHIRNANRWDAAVEFASERYAQIAIQGPLSPLALQKLTATRLELLRYYAFADGEVCGEPARIARTGYTGEDGFEVYAAPQAAPGIWDAILAAGSEFSIKPCGLGARNTLRLEAAMALYGKEIDETTTPWEAGLGWIVKMDKGDFLGREALERQQAEGVRRKLAGFEMRGRGVARDGYQILVGGRPAGRVTSGGPSPTLNSCIGLCYLPVEAAAVGQPIEIVIRGQAVPAEVVKTPFYKRARQ